MSMRRRNGDARRREAVVIAVHAYTPDEIVRRTDEEREINRQNAIIVDQVGLPALLFTLAWCR